MIKLCAVVLVALTVAACGGGKKASMTPSSRPNGSATGGAMYGGAAYGGKSASPRPANPSSAR
jgi:hypothetical protein